MTTQVKHVMNWGDSETGPLHVTVPDRETFYADIATRFQTGRGFSVATLNLDHVVKLKHDPAFRAAYAAQSHVTADGNPIVWMSHLAGQREVTLMPGSELIDPLAALAAKQGVKVALFGATDASLEAAAKALEARHSGLEVALCLAPEMGFDPEGDTAADAIRQIGDSGARLVFLALGAPKQERFAARAQDQLPEVGFLSIGAGLDFISGAQTRAPLWVRKLALEWLWRMLGNPRRLVARYGACMVILPGLAGRALRARGKVQL